MSSANGSSGFTLLEVLMGMGVVGILLVSLLVGMTSGFGVVQVTRENLRATQIMADKMETIRLYTWDQITNTTFIPTQFSAPYYPVGHTNYTSGITYNGRLTITDCTLGASYGGELKQVNVEVTWTSGRISRSRRMTSYVARNGLQPYIY